METIPKLLTCMRKKRVMIYNLNKHNDNTNNNNNKENLGIEKVLNASRSRGTE